MAAKREKKSTDSARQRPGRKKAKPKRAPANRAGAPRRTRRDADRASGGSEPQRLQKILAAAGVASRRECEQLVREGRVEVDRQVVTQLGTRVDPDRQQIRVDGTVLKRSPRVYYAVNKPPGVVSTSRDPSGRPRVIDMIPESADRVFAVGRLDMASEGLILLTNDGELANQLAHPRYGVSKIYEVQVAGVPELGLTRNLERGIHLAEGYVKADAARIKRRYKRSTILQIELSEGKNREIRRMLARLGNKVQRLKRVAIGPLRLGNLPQGGVRSLTPAEVARLRKAVEARPAGRRVAGRAGQKTTAASAASMARTPRKATATTGNGGRKRSGSATKGRAQGGSAKKGYGKKSYGKKGPGGRKAAGRTTGGRR
ncbi:MAG: rRNA pseudouridine synthase [Planctomycetota bacterium]|nr:MAG: rRNA pseudouridine synthase [Planctomycetota bacterium]